jgi:hypothetical protein
MRMPVVATHATPGSKSKPPMALSHSGERNHVIYHTASKYRMTGEVPPD